MLPNRSVGLAAAGRARWPAFFASAAQPAVGIASISRIKQPSRRGDGLFMEMYDSCADLITPRGNRQHSGPLVQFPDCSPLGR